MRSTPMQTCPLLNIDRYTAPLAARFRSAYAHTIIASLPPSSSEHGLRRSAQAAATFLPVPTLPVDEILSMSPLTSAAPDSPSAWPSCSTSCGTPASHSTLAAHPPECGVTSDGLSTTAFPASSACTAGFSDRTNGPFQGVITPTTPSGW